MDSIYFSVEKNKIHIKMARSVVCTNISNYFELVKVQPITLIYFLYYLNLRGVSHWSLRSFRRKISNIPKLIPSSVFDLETWNLFYFIQNLIAYNISIKYEAISQLVEKSRGKYNIIWKFWFFNFKSTLLLQFLT